MDTSTYFGQVFVQQHETEILSSIFYFALLGATLSSTATQVPQIAEHGTVIGIYIGAYKTGSLILSTGHLMRRSMNE